MPYDPELGMRVYDPREGAQQGLQIGNAFNQAFQSAQNRKLSERQIALAEQEAKEKASSLLRRQIGLKQMQDDVQQLTATGVDPMVARKTALVNNAHLIFADHPDAIQRLVTSEEANDVRAQASKMLNDYREQNLLRLRQHDEDLAEHRMRLDDERTRSRMTQEELNAQRIANSIAHEQNSLLKLQLDTQGKEAERTIKQLREDRLEAQGKRKALAEINKDADLMSLASELKGAKRKVNSLTNDPIGMFERKATRAAELAKAKENLRITQEAYDSKRKSLMDEYGVSEPDSAPAAKAPVEGDAAPAKQGQPMRLGTMIEQDGKKYRYQGGDVNDPASYVEVK